MTAPETRALVAALTAEGAAVRFVGGCVRDALLGRPVKDIDVAIPEPPETVIRLLEAAGHHAVPTGLKHGTVTAVVAGHHFEVTSLRRDIETFGRHARVAFTDDWTADAARRDFTINALFCAPDGTLYDPFGGLHDLRAGRVRFVGDPLQRIREDVLRLLRFYRIYAYYGRPPPDSDARAACRAMAPALPTLSGERVAAELLRLLLAPRPAEILALMVEDEVLPHCLPEAKRLDRLRALTAIEREVSAPDALRRLAALLEGDAGIAAGVSERLRLSRAQTDRLIAMIAPAMRVEITGEVSEDARAARRAIYKIGSPLFRDLVMLRWAEAAAEEPAAAERLSAPHRALLDLADHWRAPVFPLKGQDALALGMAPGPHVGALLHAVEQWWMEGDFAAGREEALARMAVLAAGQDPARDRKA